MDEQNTIDLTNAPKMPQWCDYVCYTDGSSNNLSPYGEGGAAYFILKEGVYFKHASKGFLNVTNNKMELLAIFSALHQIPNDSKVLIRTDSQYCIQVIDLCLRKKLKPDAKNQMLIQNICEEIRRLGRVQYEWVKGHVGEFFNTIVDEMASGETEKIRIANNIPIYNRFNSPKVQK